MAERSIAAVAQARKVADLLDGMGRHKEANDVRAVCRSNDSYRVTLQTLHRDNMELRGKLPNSSTIRGNIDRGEG